MTLNGGRWETMALVTIALPCPPPPEPLSPLTSAPTKHNSESVGGVWRLGGGLVRWVGRQSVDITHSKDLEWLFACWGWFMLSAVAAPREPARSSAVSNAVFDFIWWGAKKEIPKNAPRFSPAFLIPEGLLAWVEFTRVCPGGSRLASARLG